MPTKPREIKIAQRAVGKSLVRERGEQPSLLAGRGGLWVYGWVLVSLRSEETSSAKGLFRFLLPPRKVLVNGQIEYSQSSFTMQELCTELVFVP